MLSTQNQLKNILKNIINRLLNANTHLIMTLRNAGTYHRKFMQMIILIWKLNLKSFANKTPSILKGVDIYEEYASV